MAMECFIGLTEENIKGVGKMEWWVESANFTEEAASLWVNGKTTNSQLSSVKKLKTIQNWHFKPVVNWDD